MWRWSFTPLTGNGFRICILHVCGGDPYDHVIISNNSEYSPRMWRWSSILSFCQLESTLFSTYVDLFSVRWYFIGCVSCILHVCGGDPTKTTVVFKSCLYSPRMWRWSSQFYVSYTKKSVFSTYVEVILSLAQITLTTNSILHVCGGDPDGGPVGMQAVAYSPHMWRWSSLRPWPGKSLNVFSTHVESVTVLERTDK